MKAAGFFARAQRPCWPDPFSPKGSVFLFKNQEKLHLRPQRHCHSSQNHL